MAEKLDLSQFEKKMIIRPMEHKDIQDIITMQSVCFPGMEPWKVEHLESHLDVFPEGQLVAELEGEIIASCSSLIINFDEYDDRHTWDDVTDNGYITNHNPDGYNLYGIEVMVHPDYRRMKVGHRLYEARKDLARKWNLKSIIIGGGSRITINTRTKCHRGSMWIQWASQDLRSCAVVSAPERLHTHADQSELPA